MTGRYSDKRLNDSFYAYVLLSEPVTFRMHEIVAALKEDYPTLGWGDSFYEEEGAEHDGPFTVGDVLVASLFPKGADNIPGMIGMHSMPGRCDLANWPDLLHKNRFNSPEAGAAVARHTCCLCIQANSVDNSLEARFDAARRVTAVAAVFAALPVAELVYWPNGDTLTMPDSWVAAAQKAARGEVPLLQWIHFGMELMPNPETPQGVTASSVGLAAFTGQEIAMLWAPVEPAEAVRRVFEAVSMVLEHGHVFEDSDTLGAEGDKMKMRLRLLKEGQLDAQTDTICILHPSSHFHEQELELFGPRAKAPPPKGVDNTSRGDPNSLKNRLYALFAGPRRSRA
ncbi:DUF4261 domain-containing protein [Thalassococcus sp. BH17M4-6]|uniref:DUF4261 domain-containing protein n=1 Tax=Thalassococcus sp. BH17M4-6 TaxID=3413148 RepID=UPI003BBB2224